eukprot:UN32104
MVIEILAPWCVHCQHAIKDLKKASILLEGMVKVGAVNCVVNESICQSLNIQNFPTISLQDKENDINFEKYDGSHNAEDIYTFVSDNINSGLVTLDFFNFEDEVIQSEDVWLVVFSAGKWCPPCTAVKPAVRRIAHRLHGII